MTQTITTLDLMPFNKLAFCKTPQIYTFYQSLGLFNVYVVGGLKRLRHSESVEYFGCCCNLITV